MLGQGDVAAEAGAVLANTHIATFVLNVRVTLLGTGLPFVFANFATLHQSIFTWAVTDDVILSVGGVGGTVLWTCSITGL